MIRWTKDLETGIPFVDGDHRILVRLLNQVDESITAFEESATLGSVLGALRDYTVYHFGREETMLRAAGYAFRYPQLDVALRHALVGTTD